MNGKLNPYYAIYIRTISSKYIIDPFDTNISCLIDFKVTILSGGWAFL